LKKGRVVENFALSYFHHSDINQKCVFVSISVYRTIIEFIRLLIFVKKLLLQVIIMTIENSIL